MLKPHLTRDSAEQYILGALSPEASAALEAHTLECEPCARLLQEEAVLSEQLQEVAQSFPREDRVIRPARWHVRRAAAGAVGAALAAAASLALVLLPGGRAPHPSGVAGRATTTAALELEMGAPRAIVVACPDLATQDSCMQAAEERGLLVQYPWGTGEVPRYEARTGLPEGALSARHPVSL
ncbi:zf-HC2 domain-containing protein [Myxococcus sp. RHSTA-1-4]|uniref:zf-HC2 domain-containing protein n=1 Tax=Myxococcus sp. RHSTA-1-4 TaxID=2874601 RepID=UPI001CBAD8D4|nr:zf-HC2 domain-containing protein [Myxococcus sp. RHSTA-1-4]MBZ4421141.1 zf-HC2 domain-containing protein [Myxococcus sp. RHSTA-1-4]